MAEMTDTEMLDAALEIWQGEDFPKDLRAEYMMQARRQGKRISKKKLPKEAFRLFFLDFKEELNRDEYKQGAVGMIRWAEENVHVLVKQRGKEDQYMLLGALPDGEDEFGRSFKGMWEEQKKEIRIALETDDNGVFVRNLVVFCWPRGEGKSFVVILIGGWFFFNFPYITIKMSANSIDQADELHFGELRRLIENSPKLYELVGEKGITEEEIRITKGKKGKFNSVSILSTKSGLASNSKVITQSEAFEMNDGGKFFAKWYGSLRNTPNALGLMDTTVAPEGHWVKENVYKAYLDNPDGLIYFSYRGNKGAKIENYWNPNSREKELAAFKRALGEKEFKRFFENLWDGDDEGVVSAEDREVMGYIGLDGVFPADNQKTREIIRRHAHLMEQEESMGAKFNQPTNAGYFEAPSELLAEKSRRLKPIETIINLGWDDTTRLEATIPHGQSVLHTPARADLAALNELGRILNTDFALLVGVDMADPEKLTERTMARTVVSWVAKGLVGSKSVARHQRGGGRADYFYALLGLALIPESMPHHIVEVIKGLKKVFGSIEMVGAETYGMSTVKAWCEDPQVSIPVKLHSASLVYQETEQDELVRALQDGRFKAPRIPIPGSRYGDILREELEFLDMERVGNAKKYFSREKFKKGGVQDDTFKSIGAAIGGGMEITAAKFPSVRLKPVEFFGGVIAGDPLLQDMFHGRLR